MFIKDIMLRTQARTRIPKIVNTWTLCVILWNMAPRLRPEGWYYFNFLDRIWIIFGLHNIDIISIFWCRKYPLSMNSRNIWVLQIQLSQCLLLKYDTWVPIVSNIRFKLDSTDSMDSYKEASHEIYFYNPHHSLLFRLMEEPPNGPVGREIQIRWPWSIIFLNYWLIKRLIINLYFITLGMADLFSKLSLDRCLLRQVLQFTRVIWKNVAKYTFLSSRY